MDYPGTKEKRFSCQDKEIRVQLPPPHKEKRRVRSDIISSFSVRGLL